jgi:hypothetical protein
MAHWGANHGAVCFGHVGADLVTLASMLRIPVTMHNLSEVEIFRPSAWNAFGAQDQGADFRACANFVLCIDENRISKPRSVLVAADLLHSGHCLSRNCTPY